VVFYKFLEPNAFPYSSPANRKHPVRCTQNTLLSEIEGDGGNLSVWPV